MPVCLEAAPGPVLPGMCTAVNTSSWRYNPVFAPHVSSSQASQPSLSGITVPLMYIRDQLASHRTLDQRGVT